MPTALSVNAFAEIVQRSRLLSADQVHQVLQELEAEGVPVDNPEALADALVRRELLTSWQVGFLLKGKHNGFFLGSYRFLKMLGKGGMGAVYLAEHQMMRRRCAIKVLPTKLISDSSSVLDRFYLEAQAVAALDDPNIVRAYDVNKEMQGKREIHYLVMEYVDGCDLQQLVQREGRLDFVRVADFARQAASGLAHAHECGLIHRDIKPANLLIDEKGTVKILDLGLARFFDDRLDASLTTTHNESILGTADYLSPEQALDSHNVDTRTDIYSLGCTCYYMLTGHPPFPEGSVAQRLMSHQAKSPTAIEKIRPDVPPDLVTIVEKMIAKSPDNRYQTSREVADAFTIWLAQHADEGWKKKHREIVDSSASHARHEPTRAMSAATEETGLELEIAPTEELGLAPTEELGLAPTEELGLAPTENDVAPAAAARSANQAANRDAPLETSDEAEVGLDQLEELNPLTAFDTGSPSGGLDSLLNEALDNYPALDSDPNLGFAAAAAPMASGTYAAAKTAPRVAADPNQLPLLKLILIGFAVSIPLCIVILAVSSRISSSDESQPQVVASAPLMPPMPQPGDEPVSGPPQIEPPPATPPPAPSPSSVEPDRTERPSPPAETIATDPPAPPKQEPTSTPPVSRQEPPTKPDPGTPDPGILEVKETPEATTDSAPKPEPAKPRPEPKTAPTEPAADQEDRSDADKSESGPPSPERIKELLAGLSEVTVRLDREPYKKTYSYDLMVLKTAGDALEGLGLKVNYETQGTPAAVLTLSFGADKAGAFYLFNLGADLRCRDGDSREVQLWEHREEVAKLSLNAVGPTPSSVLRDKVSDFYNDFRRKYRRAVVDKTTP